MSINGDLSFANKVRQALRKAIQDEKDILVIATNERQAGRVQALQDCLVMVNNAVKDMTGDDPPPEEQ